MSHLGICAMDIKWCLHVNDDEWYSASLLGIGSRQQLLSKLGASIHMDDQEALVQY